MGFFKKLIKASNPVNQFKAAKKDPWQSIKNTTAMGLDPAGSVVRMGRGQQAMPENFDQAWDPGGFFEGRPPTNYAPYQAQPMRLSPAAQQLYDNMKARTAARQAAQQQAQQPQQPQGVVQNVARAVAGRMADGGRVRGHEDCQHYESKAFAHKPNGKPC